MLERGLYMRVPPMYTTIKSEIQQDENLMGVIKARTKEASPVLQDYGPVNWYNAPLDRKGLPVRFDWSLTTQIRDRMSSSHGWPHQSKLHLPVHQNISKILAGAHRSNSSKAHQSVERGFDEQFAYRDHYKLEVWMSRTLEKGQGRSKGLVIPPQRAPVRNPEARITMGSDMPAETCYHIMELLSDPLRPEWEDSCQIIENENRDNWSRACGLWGRPDLRPKISTKQKKSNATQTSPLDLPNLPNINQLNVQIPTGTVSYSSVETTQGEHSPEVSTPVTASTAMPGEDDLNAEGPKTPETATGYEFPRDDNTPGGIDSQSIFDGTRTH